MKLWQYIQENTIRGECQCGRCLDAVADPEKHQPEGHVVDMVFFEVAKSETATKDDFEALVKAEFPHWLNGEEQSYINMGAEIGDQGIAMMGMALGQLLGSWKVFTPKSLGLSGSKAMEMAGMGMISIMAMKNG